jgi:serine protease Do
VVVKLADNRQFAARVVGSDPPTDVAVVRIEHPPADLQVVRLGDSDRVRVGDYVLAIGNPLGLGQTVTMGIVSAKNRVIGERLGDVDPRFEDFIQTDAAINQGNSGGPLFNFRGEVIGINSAIIKPGVAMNVGFAIPIDLARAVADQIRRTGRVARGYLGVSAEDFSPERAEEMHVPFVPGALVDSVTRGSPAEAAGLAPHDVVIELGGRSIDGYRRLLSLVAFSRPGERVKLVFLRRGQRIETSVSLSGPREAGDASVLGVELRALDQRESAALGLGGGGLVVVSVDPRGPASGVLEEGDVLLALDGRPVTLPRFKALAGRLASGERATLIIQRGHERYLLRL